MNRTKTKTTTLVIALLSVLLVLSLATTVALAYFSKAKTVSTTITFGSGIDVDLYFNNTLNGNSVTTLGKKYVTDTPADGQTNCWTINGGSATITGLNEQTHLDDFAISNPNTDKTIYVAVKIVVTQTNNSCTIGNPTVTYVGSSDLTVSGKTGYKTYTIAASGNALITNDIELVSAGNSNTAQGATFTCNIYVTAVDTSVTDLASQVAGDITMVA